ncbi:MAG: hypothetical protein PHW52_02575 [Candidatus Pacebacteria bacterium]|nr:hypothetical protein [Candidatus Paceibacterota bacterium]
MPVKIIDGTLRADPDLGREDPQFIENKINSFLEQQKAYVTAFLRMDIENNNFAMVMFSYEFKNHL